MIACTKLIFPASDLFTSAIAEAPHIMSEDCLTERIVGWFYEN